MTFFIFHTDQSNITCLVKLPIWLFLFSIDLMPPWGLPPVWLPKPAFGLIYHQDWLTIWRPSRSGFMPLLPNQKLLLFLELAPACLSLSPLNFSQNITFLFTPPPLLLSTEYLLLKSSNNLLLITFNSIQQPMFFKSTNFTSVWKNHPDQPV